MASGSWGVGRNVVGVGRLGSGARSWDLHAFYLVLLSYMKKLRNENYERGCERDLIPKKFSLSG